MSLRRTTAYLAIVTLVAAGILSGCTGGDPTPGDAGESEPSATANSTPTIGQAEPTAPRPDADSCYRLSVEHLAEPTDESRPVPCSRPHTAQTIYVGRLRTVVDGHALAVDSDRVRRQVAAACPRHLAAYLGGTAETRDLSRFRVVWFSPSLTEADAGASWFRCDLVAFGRGEALLRRAGRFPRGVLAEGGLDEYGLCATAAPGSPGFERVRCGLPHRWRAIATVGLGGGKAYPGQSAVRQQGDDECQELVREQEDFALTFTYGWEWPTRSQWEAGQRFGYCWAESP